MLTIALLFVALAGNPKPAINATGNLALDGYDAVAYVTDGKPVKGLPHLTATWSGAVWRFASAEHRDVFVKEEVGSTVRTVRYVDLPGFLWKTGEVHCRRGLG